MWPENWLTIQLFCALGTQWQIGFGGPIGLRYESLYPLLDRNATTAQEWEHLFDGIQVCEREALDVMNQKD